MEKIAKKYFTIYLYILIIFSSMLPTKDNITNLSELNTIIPQIDSIYESNTQEENLQTEYSFKILEILKNIF